MQVEMMDDTWTRARRGHLHYLPASYPAATYLGGITLSVCLLVVFGKRPLTKSVD